MASPSPNASPSDANPPTTSSNSTTTATNDTSPPPQSSASLSPPPAAPPPLASSSPPPPIVASSPPPIVASSPPPSVASPPPPSVASPPPPSVASPPPPKSPPSPPPPDPNASPPAASPPPPTPTDTSPPPAVTSSPPPPNVSPPPPSASPSPPKVSPTPPSDASPPPASPPPPVDASPPPPKAPAKSPPAPVATPPPSAPPPADDTPPESASPPPSAPTRSDPPAVSPPAPVSNSSSDSSPAPSGLPTTVTTQIPTGESTTDANVTSSGAPSMKGLSTGGAVAIGVVVGVLVLSLVVMAVWFAKKKKKRKGGATLYTMPSPFASSQNSDSVFLRPHSPSPLGGIGSGKEFMYAQSESGSNSRSCFTYEEMIQATNGFSKQNLLGEGGFGCVYKGILEDGRVVAVKQLKIGGSQGEREFRAEVEIISRVHHRHLVSLVGYCISDHQRLLVYDFVQNDTLHYHLHGPDMPVMDWATRVKVAAGAARGIAYLHEDCHPRIIHRDIKSSNILLDGNFEAQVADFGLAKLALDTNTHVSTRVMGTFGYMAPEYATSGKLTDKSDVYSYGVVLLELITGRKHVDDSQPLGDESLVEWARPLLTDAVETGDLSELADPRLEKNYVESEMFRLIEAASACVRHSAAKRPRMRQVVRALDSLDDTSDLSNGMTPGHSEVYNSADHSAHIRRFQKMAFASQEYSTSYFNQSQSSWKSRDTGNQSRGSWNIDHQEQSREHRNQSRNTWSRDQRDKDTIIPIDRSEEWNL